MKDISKMDINSILPVRDITSHKGTFGRLTAVCGSVRYRGAAVLSSVAAVRSGAGVVRIAGIEEVVSPAIACEPSLICLPLEKDMGGCISVREIEKILCESRDSKSILVGCGLGCDNDMKLLVREIIAKSEKTMILDADALNAVSEIGCDVLKECVMSPVITPHIGEMARLTGTSPEAVSENMEETAKTFSMAYSCVTVLKGSKTVISDKNGDLYILDSPNAALATAGSGDVLAGIIAGLSVQGISPVNSAVLGVYIHSEAGKNAAKKYSTYSTTAKDILEQIPEVFLSLGR